VQRGFLSTTKVGREVVYTFTDAGERIFSEAGLRVRAQRPFASTATVWTLASFSVAESRRDLRSRLRIHLTQKGFRPLRDGLWVALDSFAAELVTRDLDSDLAENCQLDIFIVTPYRSSGLAEVIRRGWDLDDLRTRHERFLTRWEHLDPAESEALPLLTLFSADWLDLLQHDPGLPAESLGDDWPGARSAATAYRTSSHCRLPLETHSSDYWSPPTPVVGLSSRDRINPHRVRDSQFAVSALPQPSYRISPSSRVQSASLAERRPVNNCATVTSPGSVPPAGACDSPD
jgi:hypothetical protein